MEAMLLKTQDPSQHSMAKVTDSVNAAVSAAVGQNEFIQNAVAQVESNDLIGLKVDYI